MDFEAQLLELLERAGPQSSLISAGAASKVLLGTLEFEDASRFCLQSQTQRDILRSILLILEEAARSSAVKPVVAQALFLDKALTAYTRKLTKADARKGAILAEDLRKIEIPLS
jgi:hypothetical protein